MSDFPQTSGGRMLRRFIDLFDPECSRTTARLRIAAGLLSHMGVEPTVEHSDRQIVEWGRPKHACDDRCRAVWPAWATGNVFDSAYRLASVVQTERGKFNRSGTGL